MSQVSSMTGYGRATRATRQAAITVELRSTNHRFFELEPRLSNGLSAHGAKVAEVVRQHVRRGRVELSGSAQFHEADRRKVVVDEAILHRYHETLQALQRRFRLKDPITLTQLLALPQALSVVEDRVPTEQLVQPLLQAVEAAARELARSRQREGARLVADLRRQLQAIARHVAALKRRLPIAFRQQRQRLHERLRTLLGPQASGATSQLEQAVALMKDVEINEELVRLASHLTHVREALAQGGLVGKRLDFIAQELMREANTMGAKLNDAEAVQHVVAIKGCIEKIREQVQNLE